ncbi:carbohydrate ABC transporter substrate-binding protein [Rhizobium leguminosarum]|uniref:ABC transporter substrate-binding protein n=1 Tax=Rhizobium leguminosarum TaxID=384 RepID=UPI001C9552CC|nr:ABC transporter substrate-binding protein [Rhizobium leguminosarum]MBY5551609.1 carbohydrate ABC transporter substrate-binding protein [Rhizobium leguminosarum]MBY5565662.1 carbohydrate ABC transporter substrate-binding protein [Rhizobium leguminosarum]MBY5573358.1 carbohydrate ABC transporter substrate-binding protein [Rhizobium leguminosarum]MBY5580227.1 carbohydrate ABC transporter substrate-binding protein [Rhizobium leguminosarum]MBY5652824.1 carbohydrate ABC transporter substrate-bind
MQVNRRSFLMGSAGAAAGLAFGAGSAIPAFAEDAQLRAMWWGSNDRAKRTLEVAKLYQSKSPGVTVVGESLSGDGYWTKLATQMAGRSIADIFQLEPGTISDYSKRGACLPLDEFVPSALDVQSFGADMLKLTTIDGKLYGVGLGLNSFSMFFDTVEFEKAGIPLPTPDLTWDEYAKLAVELAKSSGKSGGPYAARYAYVFDAWLRQRGKSLFARESVGLGFTADDAREWFDYWEKLRKAGGTVAADVQTLDQNTIDTNALGLGKSVIGMAYSNQMIGYQLIIKNKLGITMLPREKKGGPSGHYYRPALIWSVGATTKQGEAAAKFISFFVNDPEAGKILGVERGVPMSPTVREAILPQLNPTEQETVKYVNLLKDQVGEYPPPVPMGATQFDQRVLRPICDELAFERVSPADAATRLIEEGKATIKG